LAPGRDVELLGDAVDEAVHAAELAALVEEECIAMALSRRFGLAVSLAVQ
jgi:hypothetical protein